MNGACPLLALSGHGLVHCKCPLLGVKRTLLLHRSMSAYDPKRTWADFTPGILKCANLSLHDALS